MFEVLNNRLEGVKLLQLTKKIFREVEENQEGMVQFRDYMSEFSNIEVVSFIFLIVIQICDNLKIYVSLSRVFEQLSINSSLFFREFVIKMFYDFW